MGSYIEMSEDNLLFCKHIEVKLNTSWVLQIASPLPIVWTPPTFLKVGGVNFDYLPRRGGGIWKIEKKEWKYCGGASLFKRGGLALFLFKVYHFYIYKLLYPLQNCVMYLQVILIICIVLWFLLFFSCHHNFMKKVIPSCLKMDLK